MGIAGNKFDLFSIEEVTEEEGKKFAKEIGAFFFLTSAKESIGIEELFKEVGKKFLDLKNNKNEDNDDYDIKNKLDKEIFEKKKKCC